MDKMTAKEQRDLLDLARNIAGVDDRWLVNATESTLRTTILELRTEARGMLDAMADRINA